MRILSLDGGGYLGLASAAFLAEAENHFGTKCHDQFDLFCGTSTGAIIALAFANGMSARNVVDLYQRLGQDVFPSGKWGRFGRLAKSFFTTRYGNAALKRQLNETFGDATLNDV